MKGTNGGLVTVGDKGFIFVNINTNPSYDKIFDFFNNLILNELAILDCETWIAGGALREYFLKKEITTDIDLYFNDDKNFELAKNWFLNDKFQPVEQYSKAFRNKFKNISEEDRSQILKDVVNRPIGKVILENNAALKIEYKNVKIDLVKKYRPNPYLTIESFDFTITMAALDYNTFYCSPSYFVDLLNKDLVIENFHNPLSTLQRLPKYLNMGFKISKENMYELAKNIKSTPIAEINPIEFQLDQLENPNGVVEVDRPIKQRKKQEVSHGTAGGYNYTVPQAVVQAPPEPERMGRGILDRIFQRENRDNDVSYNGY